MKQELILTQGLPASGKTTWALAQVKKSNGRIKRVSKDDLRAMLDGGEYSKLNEHFVVQIEQEIAKQALMEGRSVIIDSTNYNHFHIKRYQQLTSLFNEVEFRIERFETDLATCIERDKQRPNPVGEEVIANMYKQYVEKAAPVYNPNLQDAIIVDIDGTLAHMNRRSPYDWSRVKEDTPDKEVVELVRLCSSIYTIIIMSGRDSCCRKDTEEWLKANDIPFEHLYMRAEKDTRADEVIKLELYKEHVEGQYNVSFILDDRDRMVRMWRDQGFKCLQCAPGNF